MQIEIHGIPGDAVLQAHVSQQLDDAVAPLSVKPVAAEVTFSDDNGPKGGVAVRCALTLRLPRRRALHVDHLAETPRLAFDGGFARLERRLAEDRGRARQQRRRPKKYYVAKRLLAEGGEAGGPAPDARAG